MTIRVMPQVVADEISLLVESGSVKVQVDLSPVEALDLSQDLALKVAHMIEVREQMKELEDA